MQSTTNWASPFELCASNINNTHTYNIQAHSVPRVIKPTMLLWLITPSLRSLYWLKIAEWIDYKVLSLTYKVLTTTEPSYLHDLISLQPYRSTRSCDVVTLARPPLCESQQPLFPPCLTSSLEWTSQRTSPTRRSRVHVTVLSSFSHRFIIIIIIIIIIITTFTMHHSIFVHFRLKTYLFYKSFPSVSLTFFSDGSHRFLWPFPDLIAHRFFLLFGSFHLFLSDLCDRLSWFYQLLNCT